MSTGCPLCGEPLGRPAFPYELDWAGSRYVYRRCPNCPTVMVDPVPSDEQREEVFAYEAYHEPDLTFDEEHRNDRSLRLMHSELPDAKTVLDFGCGTGSFLRAARSRGYSCEGIEYEAEAIAHAAAMSGVPVRSLAEVLASESRFDVIRVGHVLTVLADPAETLRSLAQLVAPGGHLLIESAVEMNASVSRWLLPPTKAVRRRVGLSSPAQHPPTQLWRTSQKGLSDFLENRMGYHVVYQRLFDDGWPFRAPGRSAQGAAPRLRGALADLAIAASRRGLPLGNQTTMLVKVAPGGP